MSLNANQLDNLSKLLMSKDESNALVAFEIIQNHSFPHSLISEIFAFFKTTDDKSLRAKAKALLETHGSPELNEVLNKRYPLKSSNSSNRRICRGPLSIPDEVKSALPNCEILV